MLTSVARRPAGAATRNSASGSIIERIEKSLEKFTVVRTPEQKIKGKEVLPP